VIARTNIMDMYNHARLTMMQRRELTDWVQGYRYSAILDSQTTPICRALHGKIFTRETLNGWAPPNHFQCRSVLLPVTLLDEGWRVEMDGQGAINAEPQAGFKAAPAAPHPQRNRGKWGIFRLFRDDAFKERESPRPEVA
jgi:SPP1 gp7 family putative phage head morphogenesis protein